MLKSVIVAIVTRCTRHAWGVIIVASLLAVGSAVYAAMHFGINTDVNTLISQDLPWRQREMFVAPELDGGRQKSSPTKVQQFKTVVTREMRDAAVGFLVLFGAPPAGIRPKAPSTRCGSASPTLRPT